ncbi:hypothetical protein JTE90_024795 [Oedothorax gibbosus]|uniref:Uncharacterized protein n=1 Tax=Oedothorax gibbosus TaxID=931172 RepID=A0AAV6U0D5_9ARAC|nr:hypothetical protein JTE90_024795 [Oedothorax gibbosus]
MNKTNRQLNHTLPTKTNPAFRKYQNPSNNSFHTIKENQRIDIKGDPGWPPLRSTAASRVGQSVGRMRGRNCVTAGNGLPRSRPRLRSQLAGAGDVRGSWIGGVNGD